MSVSATSSASSASSSSSSSTRSSDPSSHLDAIFRHEHKNYTGLNPQDYSIYKQQCATEEQQTWSTEKWGMYTGYHVWIEKSGDGQYVLIHRRCGRSCGDNFNSQQQITYLYHIPSERLLLSTRYSTLENGGGSGMSHEQNGFRVTWEGKTGCTLSVTRLCSVKTFFSNYSGWKGKADIDPDDREVSRLLDLSPFVVSDATPADIMKWMHSFPHKHTKLQIWWDKEPS